MRTATRIFALLAALAAFPLAASAQVGSASGRPVTDPLKIGAVQAPTATDTFQVRDKDGNAIMHFDGAVNTIRLEFGKITSNVANGGVAFDFDALNDQTGGTVARFSSFGTAIATLTGSSASSPTHKLDISATPASGNAELKVGAVTIQGFGNTARFIAPSLVFEIEGSAINGALIAATTTGGGAVTPLRLEATQGQSGFAMRLSTSDTANGNSAGVLVEHTVNKPVNGDYTALRINAIETSAPGTDDRLLVADVGGINKFRVANDGQITNTVSTGTAPLVVASTTTVANLSAEFANGSKILTGSATADMFGATGGNTVAAGGTTITVTGASAGDPCSLGTPAGATADSTYTCTVTAANVVTVYRNCANGEAAGVANACADDGSLTWKAAVTH